MTKKRNDGHGNLNLRSNYVYSSHGGDLRLDDGGARLAVVRCLYMHISYVLSRDPSARRLRAVSSLRRRDKRQAASRSATAHYVSWEPPGPYLHETFQSNTAEAVAQTWREEGILVGLRRKLFQQHIHNRLRCWRRRRGAAIVVADDPLNNVSWNGPRQVRNGGGRHPQAVDVSVITHSAASPVSDRTSPFLI